jgi:hypothetical protein
MAQRTTPMPVIAGVLIIVSGAFKLLALLVAVLLVLFVLIWPPAAPWLALGVVILVICAALAVVSIIGGIAALRRRSWGLALAGAVIAALPLSLLGIAAIVLIALSREEFPSAS